MVVNGWTADDVHVSGFGHAESSRIFDVNGGERSHSYIASHKNHVRY